MRCVIAKMNLVLMNKAIAHYLEPSTQGTVFTFPSLYDDNEPYPLPELLLMVQEQIGLFESQFKEKPNDALANSLSVWQKKLNRLAMVQESQQRQPKGIKQ